MSQILLQYDIFLLARGEIYFVKSRWVAVLLSSYVAERER